MMRETLWFKLKCRFCRQGRSQRETDNGLPTKLSVNEEYLRAFRTKSCVEISERVQKQLRNSPSTSESFRTTTNLSEYLIQPRQETLKSILESFSLDHLLLDYFIAVEEAYDIYETLLRGVNKARVYYCEIKRAIKLSKSISKLTSFSVLENPLSIISPLRFRQNQNGYSLLLQKLRSKGRKVRRKLAIKKLLKKVGRIIPVAVPAMAACFMAMMTKKKMKWKALETTESLERLGDQLDHASKGIYITMNDFDTLSRMAMRVRDEVDHWKAIAGLCVENGKRELVKEAVKEFHVHDSSFEEQLEELEQHICLSYLTMNRSVEVLLQQIMAANGPQK